MLEFDTQNNTEIFELIKNLIVNEGGENFYGTDAKPIQSEYLDEKTRARNYRSWLESELRDGERRNYISEALRKVEERIAENERVKTENKARADITRVTKRLGDDIAGVYGFHIPKQKQPSDQAMY